MSHADLLKSLLPPVSYDPQGFRIGVELSAEGSALDAAEASAEQLCLAFLPQLSPLLSDWERVLGLPDGCAPAIQTAAGRLAAVLTKIRATGGLSASYYTQLAADLGYTITITEFTAHTCESPCDYPLFDHDPDVGWQWAWRVNAPETTIYEFSCDSTCEDPLRWWGNEVLECQISKHKPAHTHVFFGYGG